MHRCALLLGVLICSGSAAAEEGKPPEGWEGSLSLGAVALAGNAKSLTLSGDVLVDDRSDTWELHAELGAILGLAAGAGKEDVEPAAEWLQGHVRGERRLLSRLSAFLLLGGEINRPASLAGRAEGEAGVGVTLIERDDPEQGSALLLRLYLGAHLANDARFQYFPIRRDLEDLLMVGPGAGLRLRWKPDARVEVTELLRVYPNVVGAARVLAYSDTRLAVKVTERLALELHLLLELDTLQAEDRRPLDLALTTGLQLQL